MDSSPMSGTPAVAFAIPAPLMYTASKPARSTWRAIAAFGTPGSITQPCAINCRNRAALLLLVIPNEPLSCRAKSRHLQSFLRHFQLLHQFVNVVGLIQLPRQGDNPFCPLLANCGLHERKELLFHL